MCRDAESCAATVTGLADVLKAKMCVEFNRIRITWIDFEASIGRH